MDSARRRWTTLASSLLLLLGAASLQAQSVTTGALTGRVQATDDTGVLPGATVTAVHVPTGTQYVGVADESGRFNIPNVRVGGPYTVTAALDGFQTTQVSEVNVPLGAAANVLIELPPSALSETIEVVADADPLINPNRTGAGTSVSEAAIETLPTVNRSLQDFARTNPYFTIDAGDASATRMSVGGRNNRYNSIQIDGAVNNDVFGLADTGTPGGQADTQPISLDAIQELQLVVSPYDVRQAGFTGGGVNAITRSGSNQWHGSVYGTQRDESFVGELNDQKVSAFEYEQYGLRLGGPIVRDKAFFFVSGETNSRENPDGWAADGSAANQFRDPAFASAVRDVLRNQYGYDPGGLGEFVFNSESDLFLVKLDWNAAPSHLLTLRHNYVDAFADRQDNSVNSGRWVFSDHTHDFNSETNSTVVQLNSTFGSSLFNEARIGYQTIRDQRVVGPFFPHVEVTGPGGVIAVAGVNRFSQANSLDQDILEITDDLTWIRGDHTFTIGTANQFFTFSNVFLDAFRGFYSFRSLADLQAGQATGGFAVGFSNTGSNAVEFDVRQYGLYAGDQWRMNDNLTLTYGLRVDMPTFPDSPTRNETLFSGLGIDTSDTPSSMLLWQPRLGFNWSPDGLQQVRGGTGIFAGRTPYVWISNNYQNNGIAFSNLSTGATVPFNPNQAPPRTGTSFLPRIDAIDPDFEFPQVWRTTLAYDRELPWQVQGTVEAIYSKTVEDVRYTNPNLVQNGTLPDGRPRYTRVDPRIDAVYFLDNTSEGEELNLSLQLRKRFEMGLEVRGMYTHSDAESLGDYTSSRAVSNYRHSANFDVTDPDVATSLFEIEHRGLLTALYNFRTGALSHDVGLFYSVQSGAPITYRFSNDVAGAIYGSSGEGNALLYVPSGPDDVLTTGGLTWAEIDAYISSDDCLNSQRGQVYERNSCKQPYVRQLDFHYGLGLDIGPTNVQITADILNLLNLIDEDEGVYYTTPFGTVQPFRATVDPATGKYVYSRGFSSTSPGGMFSLNSARSRWQARLGLRVSF